MKFDIFSELDAARIEEIKAASKYAQLPKGSILFYEGDVCDSVLYLTQGRIKILAGANGRARLAHPRACHPAPNRRTLGNFAKRRKPRLTRFER